MPLLEVNSTGVATNAAAYMQSRTEEIASRFADILATSDVARRWKDDFTVASLLTDAKYDGSPAKRTQAEAALAAVQ